MAIQLNPLSVPLGLVAGTLVALIGREEPLRFWPLLIVGCFATRMFATSAVATFTGLLTVIVIRQLNATMAGITLATELQYGEAILYDHAGRVLRGEQLYQPLDRPPYTVAAYTPVYYWLAAGARSVLGPGFASGRILTFLAGLAVAWAIAFVVGRQTRDRWAGVFAALLFLALGLPWVDRPADPLSEGNLFRLAASSFLGELIPSFPDLAVYKEDLLGVALSLATIAVLISGTTPRRLVVAGLFAGLAFLTKQVFIAAGLAGAIWLWRRNAENAMVFAGAGFILVFGTCLTLELTSRAFLANTVLANVNPMNPQVLIFNLALLARFQAGPFVLAVIFLFDRLRSREEDGSDLLLYYWVSSLLPLVGLAKVGASANHWMEFAASTSLLATLCLWSRVSRSAVSKARAILPVFALAAALPLVIAVLGDPVRLRPGSLPGPDSDRTRELSSLVERVRSEPRMVLSSALDVVVLSGRPLLFEPYIFSILYSQDRWNPDPLVRRICGGQVGLLIFYNRLEDGTGQYHGYAFWPAPVVAALQETMVLEQVQAGYYLYVPEMPGAKVTRPEGSSRLCAD